jgi:hypothetical protein
VTRGSSPISLGGSPVSLVTFRGCIPNSALLRTQFHIHSTAFTGNLIHHTTSPPNMRPQRTSTRVPSRKAQEANQTFEIYEDLETCLERLYTTNQEVTSTSHSTSEQPAQPTTTTNNPPEATEVTQPLNQPYLVFGGGRGGRQLGIEYAKTVNTMCKQCNVYLCREGKCWERHRNSRRY